MDKFIDSIPCTVEDTLRELTECAFDVVASSEGHSEDLQFKEFIRVGQLVLETLDEVF